MSGTLNETKRQILECINNAYYKGYKNGLNDRSINEGTFAAIVKEAYGNGLNDTWECAKKIVTDTGLNHEELREIFGYTSMDTIFGNFSASEAIAKIKEYENRQKKSDDEIHIGDEVYCLDSKYKYVVLGFLNNDKIFVFSSKGLTGVFASKQVHKTGRNYPVKEILEGLKNGEE